MIPTNYPEPLEYKSKKSNHDLADKMRWLKAMEASGLKVGSPDGPQYENAVDLNEKRSSNIEVRSYVSQASTKVLEPSIFAHSAEKPSRLIPGGDKAPQLSNVGGSSANKSTEINPYLLNQYNESKSLSSGSTGQLATPRKIIGAEISRLYPELNVHVRLTETGVYVSVRDFITHSEKLGRLIERVKALVEEQGLKLKQLIVNGNNTSI